jgi:methyltransferase
MTLVPPCAGTAIFLAMLLEARLSAAHDRWLRARGAVEPAGDVYALMQLAYPAAFIVMIVEGVVRGVEADRLFLAGSMLFAAAKLLKYWAMITLGPRWTFRVLVPPHSTRITSGPYRWLNHPNYLSVAGELTGTAIAMHALVTGPFAVAGFVALMRARVTVEERALGTSR